MNYKELINMGIIGQPWKLEQLPFLEDSKHVSYPSALNYTVSPTLIIPHMGF